MQFDLLWANALLLAHGRHLRDQSTEFASVFRALQKSIMGFQSSIARICDDNSATLAYLLDQSRIRKEQVDQMDLEAE